jgi:hypothetical protein
MAICNGDFLVEVIEATECIGNSLVKINNNFKLLDKSACETEALRDAILNADGILASDGEGNVFAAEPGRDYYYPGMAMDWNVVIYGTATISNDVLLQAGANLRLENGNISCTNLLASNIDTGTMRCTGPATVGGTLDVTGSANFKSGVNMSSMSVAGDGMVAGQLDVGGLGVDKNLDVTGRIACKNDIVAFALSDQRLKKDITVISNPLQKINSLKGVEFDWNTELQDVFQGKDTGVIAQEVEEVMPTAVAERDNGYKAVKYEKLIPLLIEAVKELTQQNVALKAEIEALKNK